MYGEASFTFINKHIQNQTLKSLHLKKLWVTSISENRGLGLQRNLPPTLVECHVNFDNPNHRYKYDEIILYKIGKSGKTLSQTIPLYDNAGNHLRICHSEDEAINAYNQELTRIQEIMDKRIQDIHSFKAHLHSLVI